MNFHLLIAMILGTMALPQGVWANELAELENELTQFQESYDENEAPLPIWEQTELLQAISLLEERGCNESYTLRHSDRFVTSFNSAGEPCKTYDLGASADEALPLPQMPVKKMGPRAYLDLLRGNDNRTMNLMPRYARSLRAQDRDRFWKPVRDRMGPTLGDIDWDHVKLSEVSPRDIALPADLQQNLALLEQMKPPGVDFDFSKLRDMNQFLEMIQLDWDDSNKTYSMNFTEDLTRLTRQAVLINYNNPLILMWNQMFRSVMSNALQMATLFIPDLVIGNIARIAIVDTFALVDIFQQQRVLRLETVLRLNLKGEVPTEVDPEVLRRGINLLYAHREGAMMRWVWDSIKNFSFTWKGYERIADLRREVAEQRREDLAERGLRALVNKRCAVTEVYDNFGICFRRNQPQAIFNLNVTRSFLFIRFGPIIVYNHQRPWEVWTKRIAAWTLSVASRLFSPFQYDPTRIGVNSALTNTLRSFAIQGWAEEAEFYENLNHSELDPRILQDAVTLRDQ